VYSLNFASLNEIGRLAAKLIKDEFNVSLSPLSVGRSGATRDQLSKPVGIMPWNATRGWCSSGSSRNTRRLQRIPVKLTHRRHVGSSCGILHEKVSE
jgi:hypothetical protein